MSSIIPVSKSAPCPICNHEDWCYSIANSPIVCCKRLDTPPEGWEVKLKGKRRDKEDSLYFYPKGVKFEGSSSDSASTKPSCSLSPSERHEGYSLLGDSKFLGDYDAACHEELHRRKVTVTESHKCRGHNWMLTWEKGKELPPKTPLTLPGVSDKTDKTIGTDGLGIGAVNLKGEILGYQVRILGKGFEEGRYRAISGGVGTSWKLPNGEQPITVWQYKYYSDDSSIPVTRIIFAEGFLKSLLIALNLWRLGLTHIAVVGTPGSKFGTHKEQIQSVVTAFPDATYELAPDAGMLENKSVMGGYEALYKLVPTLKALWWDQADKTEEGNDLDDFLIQGRDFGSIEQIEWDEFRSKSEPDTVGENGGESTEAKPNKPKPETAGDKALRLAKLATYFHTSDKVAYADIPIDGNRHTYAVRSRSFRLWLTGAFYRDANCGLSPQVLTDLFPTLEAMAICDGETREVHLRTAEHQDKLYLDLGTEDWKAVEIDSSGWRVISDPPVRFWRPESLLPLPYPVEGGRLDELKELLNVDRQSWVMIATFLLFCFCPNKTYPVLVLAAHRGSGKTAAAEIIKGLIDPGKAGLIKLQGDTHKLAIAATRRHLMVYDNVGHISPDQSDDLCRIATGFGYSTRTLHTTDEETVFEFTRPQIITAIDALVTRDDLADRVLMAQLPEIPEDKRLSQNELNEKVESSRPRILGALLTALSQTLAELPHAKPDKLPRMADYALFAIASEKALEFEKGEFMQTFNESREQSRQIVIESSPVGEAIINLMEKTSLVWKGTASELLKELESYTDDATYRSRYFPKSANMLTRQINRLAPDLKALGIEISSKREGHDRTRSLCIEKSLKVSQRQADELPTPTSKRVLTEDEF